MRVGLYSITYLGLWYRGAALSLEDVIRRARAFGYDGVEIDGKRPHGNPLDLTSARCRELGRVAGGEAIEIYAVAANNDFSSPIPEQREAQIAYVRGLIGMTADLGAPLLRVFAAWPGVTRIDGLGTYDIARALWRTTHENALPEETWEWCREGLLECARYAADAGITLALQNHPPVINTHRDMLRMIAEIGAPNLKACLDAPLVAKYEQTPMREAVRATGDLQVLSHFGDPGEFYPEFVAALHETGYRGYIGYELCHALPSFGGHPAGLEFVDESARAAAEYMRGITR